MNLSELYELKQEYCEKLYQAENAKDVAYYEKQIEEIEKQIQELES